MAYGLKYITTYQDKHSNNFKVELLKKDYEDSSSFISKLDDDPISISYSGDKNSIKYVQGSSLTFSFLEDRTLGENYDDIFSSDYLDYKLIYTNTDSSSLIWMGYVKPENLNRPFSQQKRFIQLEATDAIADLKDISFTNIGYRTPILSVIKSALEPLNIELPFKIQVNTWEVNQMVKGQCPIEKGHINTQKFLTNQNGKSVYDSCYTVIERVLQPFNAQLKQVNGNYYIINNNEIDSSLYTYDWPTLTQQSITNTNNIVDISTNAFTPSSDFTKIRPLKTVDLTFANKELGTSLVPDISAWANDDIWRIKTTSYSVEADDVLYMHQANPVDCSIGLVQPFNVNYINGNEYVKLQFDYKIDPISDHFEQTDGDAIYFKLMLWETGEVPVEIYNSYISRSIFYQHYESEAEVNWKIPRDTTYNFYLIVTPPEDFNDMHIRIKNLQLTQVSYKDGEIIESVIYDKNFIADISINKDRLEDKIYFADSDSNSEISSITIGNNVLSSKWINYNGDSSGNLQYLYAKNILRNNQSFRDYIRIEAFDSSLNINHNSIIKLGDSKQYSIIDYERDYTNQIVKLSLNELITTNPSYFNFSQIQLTSANGVPTQSTIVVDSGGSAPNIDYTKMMIKNTAKTGYILDLPFIQNDGSIFQWVPNTSTLFVNGNVVARGEVTSFTGIETSIGDLWSTLRYVKEASLGTTFYWTNGVLNASTSGSGGTVNSSTWSISGSNIYYNTGGVAIGSTDPAGRTFHLTGNMTVTQGAIINDIKVNRSTGGANYPSYPDIYATSGGIVIGGLSNGTGTVSFATTGSATLPSMHIDTTGHVKINSGNLIFDNNESEKFIRGSKNGGAIRLRSNMAAAVDRGIQLGQIDNLGNWAFTYLDLQEGGHAINGNVLFRYDNKIWSRTSADVGYNAGITLFNGSGNMVISNRFGVSSTAGRIEFQTSSVNDTPVTRLSITRDGNLISTGSYLSFDGAGLLTPPTGLNYGLFPHSAVGLGLFSYANKISFWGGGASPVEYMRLSSGNLLLGTTSNTALAGTTGQVIYHSSSPAIAFQNSSGYWTQYMSGADLRWYNGTLRLILTSTGNLNAIGEVTSYYSSDASLKSEIKPFSALGIIHQLQPKTFKWNDRAKDLNDKKDDRNNFGLIAQDVEKVLPELVHNIYNDYKSVDYVQLIPILIQAMKKQQKQINDLKQDLNYYKNMNT